MPTIVLHTRLSPDRVRRAVQALPGLMSGRAGESPDALSLQLAVGMMALSLIKKDFLEKSKGGRGSDNRPWKPLAPSTLARRRKGRGKGGMVEILRDTGILFNSLSPGVAVRASPGQVIVGTNVPYAAHAHAVRPLWPDPRDWPSSWWAKIGGAARDAMLTLLRRALGGG